MNTGILLLLVQANFTEIHLPLESFLYGNYKDFIPDWYTVVGYKITQTMLINAFMPFVEITIAYSKLNVFRRMDRSWTKDTYKTKKTSMQLYIDLYSGPEYMIHFKYSGILNVCFITMMYGMGIPILFIVAALTYFNLYSVEKLAVAYFYQLPPTFDDALTKNALGILRWGSVLYCFFGYWMLSNKQIFHNIYEPYIDTDHITDTKHTF